MKTTVPQHLHEFHKMAAAHHLALAKAYNRLAECMTKAAKSDMKDGDKDENESAGVCREVADAHVAAGEYHAEAAMGAKELDGAEKAMGIDDGRGERIVPDGVQRIIPASPRMEPRPGAPSAAQLPKVALGLEKFVEISEE